MNYSFVGVRISGLKYLILLILSIPMTVGQSQNPLIRHMYTADPAAHEFSDGRLYLFADRDPNGRNNGWLNMYNYHVLSTGDMITWIDHGSVLDCRDIQWNDGAAWDGDCVEANGKYYYYFPMVDKIGVAVADKPAGPFRDALGHPLVTRKIPGVQSKASGWLTSPCILFYQDSIYMYMGQNEEFYVVKLKKNMIELDGPVVPLKKPQYFHEAAWVNYENGYFHATYGGNDGKGKDILCYAISKNPYGPFTFQYFIQTERASTVQNCITRFKGKDYIFYHQDGPDPYHRQISAEPFQYSQDGKIPPIKRTLAGIGNTKVLLDAYGKREAEDFTDMPDWGIERSMDPWGEGNMGVRIQGGNTWIKFGQMDFGTGAKFFEAYISSAHSIADAAIEIRIDSLQGEMIGKCKIPNTGGWYVWEKTGCEIFPEISGVHDVFFVFRGEPEPGFYYKLSFMMDYFRFIQ